MIREIANKTQFKKELGFGLVEALISLAVVGTGMIIITTLSLRSLKLAKKNELQDVAVQVAVEGVDFMKNPSTLVADYSTSVGSTVYYELSDAFVLRNAGSTEINADTNSCHGSSPYVVRYLYDSDILVCQQIAVTQVANERYDVKVIVVWESVNGEFEKRVISGYRVGAIDAQ